MLVKTAGDVAKFYMGYTITPDGTEIEDENVLARLKDNPQFVIGGQQPRKPKAEKPASDDQNDH